jgi:hypothetical protein
MKYEMVINGEGYDGCKLIPALLEEICKVSVFDLMIYGNGLAGKKIVNILKRINLKNIKKKVINNIN